MYFNSIVSFVYQVFSCEVFMNCISGSLREEGFASSSETRKKEDLHHNLYHSTDSGHSVVRAELGVNASEGVSLTADPTAVSQQLNRERKNTVGNDEEWILLSRLMTEKEESTLLLQPLGEDFDSDDDW